jgi:predicted  nucleic acid-binding Zn-ribbon protein
VYKNEVKQLDYQIELEEEKIKELKEELEKKKELNSHEFKEKLEEIDQLETKKSELKDQISNI